VVHRYILMEKGYNMAQFYIYTRTKELDYRAIAIPSEDFCSKEDRLAFRHEIQGVIDVETYVDELNEPRWFYSKRKNLVLFGIGVMNKELSDTCNTDYVGTPIRGFFGVVFKIGEIIELPYDKEFFSKVYKKYVEPIWNIEYGDDNAKQKIIEVEQSDLDETNFKIVPQDNHISLNEQVGKCVILGKIDCVKVFQQALYNESELSVVTGFNNRNHAYAKEAKYKFLNALVNGVDVREEQETIKPFTKQELPTQTNYQTSETPIKPKKDSRLKLMSLGAIVTFIVIALILGRCSKNNQTNPQKSVSGDTVKTVKNIQKK